ncbi:hypothetical protein DRE_00932 [Drechslerella stenobrocha 248]|uniref:F-box domain-containing protein n=1 Tax=Drechslerella stenobrocha 248 TaxID=1043628 RepID=W7HY57_9PEZI|nr:hypothetical protein DRE_00932 [Drechslerella stenobrocha 248]
MARIVDLPNELLEEIARTLRRICYDSGSYDNVLVDFCMTCRAFYRVAFRDVYDDLDLAEKSRCTSKRVRDLLYLISKNPDRGYAVERLSIGPWDRADYSSHWPKLESFTRSYDFLKRTVQSRKLHEEDLGDLEHYPCSLLVAALFYLLPNIDDLFLIMRPNAKHMPSSTRWLVMAMEIAPLPCREKLRSLEFEYQETTSDRMGFDFVPCRLTIGALLDSPNLEVLRCAENDSAENYLHLDVESMQPYIMSRELQEANHSSQLASAELSLSPDHMEAYRSFMSYDPMNLDKIQALQSTSSITEMSFCNNPCTIWPIPMMLRIPRKLKAFDCFIGSKTRDNREQVLAIHEALLEHKETLTEITLSYYKGFENRSAPNFQLDFSEFRNLESLQASIILLADIEQPHIEMGDILPASLETLTFKIRYSTIFRDVGRYTWDQAVLQVITKIAELKNFKLDKLKTVDVRVINYSWKPSDSTNITLARALMKEHGIEFNATTYDPYNGKRIDI